jgi:hypothetical protein
VGGAALTIKYFSDYDLENIGYSKEGLTWIIENQHYRLKYATKDGYYFLKI